MPPEYLQSLLHSIEEVVVNINEEFPKLSGPEIEWSYEHLGKYYKSRASGKEAEEPLSDSERKQTLIDEILNRLDIREELKMDEGLINNPAIRHGEHTFKNLSHLYMIAFKVVLKSARNWRKRNGRNGYVQAIKPFLRRE